MVMWEEKQHLNILSWCITNKLDHFFFWWKDNSIIWNPCFFSYQNFGGQVDDLWAYEPFYGNESKNGMWKSCSLLRTGNVPARSLNHGPAQCPIHEFCYHSRHALSAKMNYSSPTVSFPQMVNREMKDVLQRQCFNLKRINSKDQTC